MKKTGYRLKGTIGAARVGFWKSFNNDLTDSKSLSHTQSFYNGYAFGLLKSKMITQDQYIEVRERIMEKISWAETKKRRF